jgi:hypothetical protein
LAAQLLVTSSHAWRSVFGQARWEEVESVDAVITEEFGGFLQRKDVDLRANFLMKPKISTSLLLYRVSNQVLQVFVAHLGRPL